MITDCLVCERIEMIRKGTNPYFVCEMQTGYVVVGDHQRFKGYTVFLCKQHCTELHQLKYAFKIKYLEEMSLVAEAAYRVYQPDKMNYELLGNGETHLHWHLFPRYEGDTPEKGPVWWLPRSEMWDDQYRPSNEELELSVQKLRVEILRLQESDPDHFLG